MLIDRLRLGPLEKPAGGLQYVETLNWPHNFTANTTGSDNETLGTPVDPNKTIAVPDMVAIMQGMATSTIVKLAIGCEITGSTTLNVVYKFEESNSALNISVRIAVFTIPNCKSLQIIEGNGGGDLVISPVVPGDSLIIPCGFATAESGTTPTSHQMDFMGYYISGATTATLDRTQINSGDMSAFNDYCKRAVIEL